MKKLLFILILFCSLQGFGQIKGCWRMDGNSNDASGNGNNGTDTNITYSQANGKLNQGAGFNGSTSKIEFSGKISNSSVGTICAWIYLSSIPTNGIVAILQCGDNIVGKGVLFSMQIRNLSGTNYLCVLQRSSTDNGLNLSGYRSSGSISLSQWVFLSLVSDGNSWFMYINSIPQTLIALSFNSGTNNGDWFGDTTTTGTFKTDIGAGYYEGSYSSFLNGNCDNIVLYESTLSQAQIKNEYSLMKGFFAKVDKCRIIPYSSIFQQIDILTQKLYI